MARPPKEGLSYSAWDCNVFEDLRIEQLMDSHGPAGFTTYFLLCQSAFSEKGYYLSWDKDYSPAHFGKKIGLKGVTVQEIINRCCGIGLFHKELYQGHQILTSERIQRGFLEGRQKRRATAYIIEDYWLLSKKVPGYIFCTQNDAKDAYFVDMQTANPSLRPQIIRDDTRREETISNINPPQPPLDGEGEGDVENSLKTQKGGYHGRYTASGDTFVDAREKTRRVMCCYTAHVGGNPGDDNVNWKTIRKRVNEGYSIKQLCDVINMAFDLWDADPRSITSQFAIDEMTLDHIMARDRFFKHLLALCDSTAPTIAQTSTAQIPAAEDSTEPVMPMALPTAASDDQTEQRRQRFKRQVGGLFGDL